jgi:hypothetical protein
MFTESPRPTVKPDRPFSAQNLIIQDVPIVPALPPHEYGLSCLFRHDPNHDLEAVRRSRAALGEYGSQYHDHELEQQPHPLRVRLARHTGLPAVLTGFLHGSVVLDHPSQAERVAVSWLSDSLVTQSLYGVDWARAKERLNHEDDIQVRWAPSDKAGPAPWPRDKATTFVHVRYQQWHRGWPVFGAQVAVHLAVADRRLVCTNSYFPLKEEISLQHPANPALASIKARILALRLLIGRLPPSQLVGPCWELLCLWLDGVTHGLNPLSDSADWLLQVARLLALALGEEASAHVLPGLEKLAAVDSLAEWPAVLHEVCHEVQEAVGQFRWDVKIAPHAGSELFLLPFAGHYYLAYRVDLIPPLGDRGWRVFVDANEEQVLGQPESMVVPAQYFATSSDAAAGQWSVLSPQDLETLHQDTQASVTLKRYCTAQDGSLSVVPMALYPEDTSLPLTLRQEAVNVAFHARSLVQHFVLPDKCGLNVPSPTGLEIRVNQVDTDLVMGFFPPGGSHSNVITFQTDDGSGLHVGDKLVYKPSLDREVVYHEMTHGLMWLLNRLVFDNQQDSVPFARALLEGYAMYLARSLAAPIDALPAGGQYSGMWARAAYCQVQWGDEWKFGRPNQADGSDHLAAPNLYPYPETVGIRVYDVGMVWARALWDIRNLLGDGLKADRLALNASLGLHGWVANFETAAEGVIYSARKIGYSEAVVKEIIDAFAARGIIAERGVQGLAQVQAGGQTLIFVGADSGVWRYVGQAGHALDHWGLKDVVALAAEAPFVYAATETGIFSRDVNEADWEELGAWPPSETPLCLTAYQGNILVGTSHGVYRLSGNQWLPWNPPVNPFERIALKQLLAMVHDNSTGMDKRVCFVADMTEGGCAMEFDPAQSNPPCAWSLTPINGARLTALAMQGDTLYAGTVWSGVWQRRHVVLSAFGLGGDAWAPVSGGLPPASAVLCLAVDTNNNQLLAGTTAGLYTKDAGDNWSLVVGGPPDAAMVTNVMRVGANLFAGTANRGLWVQDASGWHIYEVGT